MPHFITQLKVAECIEVGTESLPLTRLGVIASRRVGNGLCVIVGSELLEDFKHRSLLPAGVNW